MGRAPMMVQAVATSEQTVEVFWGQYLAEGN